MHGTTVMSNVRICRQSVGCVRLICITILLCGLAMIAANTVLAQEAPPPASQEAASLPPTTQLSPFTALDRNFQNVRLIAADLKETFASGAVTKGGANGRPDARMNILMLMIQDKIRSMITLRVADPQAREAALAQLKVAQDHLKNEILPAWEKARASQRPEDAKALVALMDGLDERMAEVREVLPKEATPALAPQFADGSQPAPESPAPRPIATPVPGREAMPRPATTLPADSWTLHVQRFIVTYNLDKSQQEQAWSILKDLRGRRQEYQAAHKLDYEAARQIPDKTRQSAELQALDKPINGMFEELKGRLAGIPTESQRNAAPTASAPASRPR